MARIRATRFLSSNFVRIPILCLTISLGSAAGADDNCSAGTYVVTCTKNQSTGIKDGNKNVVAKKDILIQSLTQDIVPASTVVGVYHYAKAGSDLTQIKVTSDLGAYSIRTSGNWATGIKIGGDGSNNSSADHDLAHVILSHTGDISTVANYGYGIWAFSTGGYGTSHSSGSPAKSNFDIGLFTPDGTKIHTDRSAVGARGVYVQGRGGDGATGNSSSSSAGGGKGGAGLALRVDGAKLKDGSVSSTGGVFNRGQVNILTEGNGQGDSVSGAPTYGAEGLFIFSQGGKGGTGGESNSFLYSGGKGGAGGDAGYGGYAWNIGQFDLGNWNIQTKGAYSSAMRVIGLGGKGGKGGKGFDGTTNGGNGGKGGDGVDINLWNYTSATQFVGTTGGAYSPGLWVLSQGGDAGNGAGGYSGGNGATGGAGGAISLGRNNGRQFYISTAGVASPGIHLRSEAGTGGNGISGAVNKGGNGGTGGVAGVISVFAAITSNTAGDYSDAFAAYSTGGGGGTAGDGGWGGGDGGSGGDAANGGRIDINLWGGKLTTKGYGSDGLVAQSIGGHAGDSGDCLGLVCFGANGGSAGDADDVSVTLNGFQGIETAADRASGIVAFSIGGGGGDGGEDFAAFYAQGSKGGKGGNGGDVYVSNSGPVTTAGNDSKGIDAKSVGGSGGNGGAAAGLGAYGGRQGGSADAGSVTVYNWNTIIAGKSGLGAGDDPTAGDDDICGVGCSFGIFAQSIGGGGGHGGSSGGMFASVGGSGSSGGDADAVFVETSGAGSITTYLEESDAIYAHSIGGGGGKAGGVATFGVGASVSVGGTGSKGGHGDDVTVNLLQGANLTTHGDTSPGINAMSLGGGGGTGGYALTVSASAYVGGAVAVGGSGGAGGNGKDVTVTADGGSIWTGGDASPGIDAHSTGGTGGKGNFAISVETGKSYAAGAFSVGGGGGGGGEGGIVTVDSNASVTTLGDQSYGIWGKSHGGGGGHGGFSIAGNIEVGSGASIAVAVGGSGGDGGDGSAVDITSSGAVSTAGTDAHGVFAHSVGGGGGSGGFAVTGGLRVGGDGSGAVDISVGGSGGEGGHGDMVSVTNKNAVATKGEGARGIYAQSVGGGGGDGGFAFAGNANIAAGDSFTVNFALGGSGGKGGNGGEVDVYNFGSITTGVKSASSASATLGDDTAADILTNAHAIFAQSVGGGGGNGGYAGTVALEIGGGDSSLDIGISLGGKGGAVGGGRDVTVTSDAGKTLTTYFDDSVGIFAQSIGGGGGRGGSSFSGILQAGGASDSKSANFVYSMGGEGGVGNHGGKVDVTNDSQIDTWGDHSHGMFVQSTGAGGGAGGSADTFVANLKCYDPSSALLTGCSTKENITIQVAVGGSGGNSSSEDSAGGDVTITNSGQIATRGNNASAIYVQSIGAGGGDGGNGSDSGFPIPLLDRTKFYTNFKVAVGGDEGVSGHGGDVIVDHKNGALFTNGGSSAGVFAQSIGGGGGRGGSAGAGLTGLIAIGGKGGAAGDGGDVNVTVAADAGMALPQITTGTPPVAGTTLGDDDDTIIIPDASYGIFAQSVGGGGGVAGSLCLSLACYPKEIAGVPVPQPPTINIGVGPTWLQDSGNGGNGGTVNVTAAAAITTYADNAIGILAQSVGGGGGVAGNAGLSVTGAAEQVGLLGSAGGGGAGGQVTVDYSGSLTTTGDGATGIFAQSAGGDGASEPGGGDVNVTVSGKITVSGVNANGILVQSVKLKQGSVSFDNAGNPVDADGNPIISGDQVAGGDSHVTVNAGSSVQGGLPGNNLTGAGVEFHDGQNNTLVNDGMITTLNPNNQAVVHAGTGTLQPSTFGSTSVINNGLILGDIQLPNANSRVVNTADGWLVSGPRTVVGGADGLLRNDGRFSIAGDGVVGKTEIDALLVQSKGGVLIFDLEHREGPLNDARADRLILRQDTRLAGSADIYLRNAGAAGLGRQTVTLVEGDKTLDATGLTIRPSAVAQYRLQRRTSGLSLSYDVDFLNRNVRGGLSGNQTALAAHLVDLHRSAKIDPDLLFLTRAEDAAGYGAALDAMSPAAYGVDGSAAIMSSVQFGDSLMSCNERSGDYRFVSEDSCLRLDIEGGSYSQSSTSQTPGYDVDWGGLSIGGQRELNAQWTVGGALAYGSVNGSSDSNAWTSDGDRYQLGAVIKYQSGPALFAASLGAGFGDADVQRNIAPGLVARGTQDTRYVGAQLRAAYLIERGDWYVKPRIDLNATYVDTGDVTETGAGAANLMVQGGSDIYWALRPSVEFGGEVPAANGSLVRPRVVLGLTQYLNDPSQNVTAHLRDAGGTSFTVQNEMDRTVLDLEAGVDILSKKGLAVSLGSFGQISENSKSYGGTVRLVWRF